MTPEERAWEVVSRAFEERTGCAVVVNTSFNVRGEPIVCSPADAYRCFMRTEMDLLVLEDCLLWKSRQPPAAGRELDYQLALRNASRGSWRCASAIPQPTADPYHGDRKAAATSQLNRFKSATYVADYEGHAQISCVVLG